MCNLRRLEHIGCRERKCRAATWMRLKSVGSAGEGNCLAIAVGLGWETSRLGLATFGREERCY